MTILKFQKEQCECPTCNLIREYSTYVQETESVDELEDILRGLISEVEESIFIKAFEEGYKQALLNDIEIKAEIVRDMESNYESNGILN